MEFHARNKICRRASSRADKQGLALATPACFVIGGASMRSGAARTSSLAWTCTSSVGEETNSELNLGPGEDSEPDLKQ